MGFFQSIFEKMETLKRKDFDFSGLMGAIACVSNDSNICIFY